MSNCWKCGRELPDGQTECEDACPGSDAAQDLDLDRELNRGAAAAQALAKHLEDMGAGKFQTAVSLNGEIYDVTIVRRRL